MFKTTSNINPADKGTKGIGDAFSGKILPGSLLVVEGSSGSGKSILSMHLVYGALSAGKQVAYYTTDKNCEDLVHQMESFDMQTRHQHLTDLLRVYSLASVNSVKDTDVIFQDVINHMVDLPQRFNLIVLDCLTPFLVKATPKSKVDMFLALKGICGKDKSIILVTHPHIYDKDTHFRVSAMSDYYFRTDTSNKIISPGLIEERNIKTLELCKVHGVDLQKGEMIEFEIKSNVGMHILPFCTVQL